MRQENTALRTWAEETLQVDRADNLIKEVELVPRRNEPGRVEDTMEEILHHNAWTKLELAH